VTNLHASQHVISAWKLTHLGCDTKGIKDFDYNACQDKAGVMSNDAVERNQRSMEDKPPAFRCKPMSCYCEIATALLVRPDVSSEANLANRFLCKS
jgi:hypothetical protein